MVTTHGPVGSFPLILVMDMPTGTTRFVVDGGDQQYTGLRTTDLIRLTMAERSVIIHTGILLTVIIMCTAAGEML